MNFEQMVAKLAKPGDDILVTLTGNKAHVFHMTSCLMGEAGELLDADPSDRDNIVEELGDLEFYMQGARTGLGIRYEEIPASIHDSDVFNVDGIMIATCDLFDACKKWIIYNQDINREKVLSAMARYEGFMNDYRGALGVTRDEVIAGNMAKLAKRYGANYEYTDAAAKARADKA
jgi:hypothetical protein